MIINDWSIHVHPLFLSQLNELSKEVERLKAESGKQGNPEGYHKKSATRHLKAIRKLMLEVIPSDPGHAKFQQGSTLGPEHKHWRRAKFFQQYRLFFRFRKNDRVIILVWVNDETSKRAYGAKSDVYRVFQDMLSRGHPPNDWDTLIAEAKDERWSDQEMQ